MPLAHFTNIDSHQKDNSFWEPIHKNLYEVTIILPTILQAIHPDATHLLLENTTAINLPAYPDLSSAEQRFKYSTRKFVMMPDSTSTDVNITFNLNQNENNQVFVWRIMKDWYDLAWNNEDGSLHYKRNIVGDIIVHVHDKEGSIIRRVVYHNCQANKLTNWSALDWGQNSEVENLQIGLAVDYWEDFYY